MTAPAPAQTPSEHETRMAEQLKSALRDLPPAKTDEVFDRLALAVVHFEDSGDPDVLRRFAESLLITARLHRNRRYLKALAEDELTDHGEPTAVDVSAMFAQARGARSAPA